VRVYVPASLDRLAGWVSSGAVPAATPAATPGDDVERYVPGEDGEESEYAALMAAATGSRQLGAERRIVVVAEVPGPDPDAAFGLDRVVAVHADGGPGAGPDDDLAWYAPEELQLLLE
jgi:hypothetical protein